MKYKDSPKLFSMKKKLKGSGTSITESLSWFRMGLRKAHKAFGIRNTWNSDGQIIYMDKSLQKPSLLWLKNVVNIELKKMEQIFWVFFWFIFFLMGFLKANLWVCPFRFLHWQFIFNNLFWPKNYNNFITVY